MNTISNRGIVKWFNPTKGYGFIQPDSSNGQDVFIHATALDGAGVSTLHEGQRVGYDLHTERGKTSAVNIVLLQE